MAGNRWPEWRLQPCGTPAAYKRHHRNGERPCLACREANAQSCATRKGEMPGALSPDFREIRNGIPWRPYRYRGTGADAFTGEVVVP